MTRGSRKIKKKAVRKGVLLKARKSLRNKVMLTFTKKAGRTALHVIRDLLFRDMH